MVRISLMLTCILVFSFSLRLLSQERVQLGKVKSPLLQEISGITPSYNHKGYFWVHNDSGDEARIYLLDSSVNLRCVVELEGVNIIDAEDVSSFLVNGIPHILLADIGNNLRNRDTLSLYLFKEPALDAIDKKYVIAKNDIVEIKFRYADKKRDAEAIFVNPSELEAYIVSKRDFKSMLFKLSLSDAAIQVVQSVSPILEFPFTFVTGADFSNDGRYIIIKNLTSIYVWERMYAQPISSVLSSVGKKYSYIAEPQGEAICFDPYNRFFYTISERPLGLDAYLYRYVY